MDEAISKWLEIAEDDVRDANILLAGKRYTKDIPMDQKSITRELNTFISNVSRSLPVKQVVLFGSFAKNNASIESDIDLLVVGDFEKRNITDPTSALYEYYHNIQTDYEFHVVGMTTRDFENRKDSITLMGIRKTGKRIYSSTFATN